MMIAIVIATYKRKDGKTPFYLTRALNSIMVQTYKEWDVYLIGDNYEDEDELYNIAKDFENVDVINLAEAKERNKYLFGDYRLFCAGGVNAALYGVTQALKDGFKYVCHLDHDDYWHPDHLKKIAEVIETFDPLFVCTISSHIIGNLPNVEISGAIQHFLPLPCGMITSSACIKYSDTELRGRDVFAETGEAYPADADLWRRLSDEMERENKPGYLIASVTCYHDEEGYSLRL